MNVFGVVIVCFFVCASVELMYIWPAAELHV